MVKKFWFLIKKLVIYKGKEHILNSKTPDNSKNAVRKKTKLIIMSVFFIMVLTIIFYKVPRAESYVGVLSLEQSSVGDDCVIAFGDRINVKINLTIHKNIIFSNQFSGTIRVNSSVFKISSAPVFDLKKKISELYGKKQIAIYSLDTLGEDGGQTVTFTRCAVLIENGKIVSVTLRDSAGNSAGTYK